MPFFNLKSAYCKLILPSSITSVEYFHEALPCSRQIARTPHTPDSTYPRRRACRFYLCCPCNGLILYFPWQYRPLYWITAHTPIVVVQEKTSCSNSSLFFCRCQYMKHIRRTVFSSYMPVCTTHLWRPLPEAPSIAYPSASPVQSSRFASMTHMELSS